MSVVGDLLFSPRAVRICGYPVVIGAISLFANLVFLLGGAGESKPLKLVLSFIIKVICN